MRGPIDKEVPRETNQSNDTTNIESEILKPCPFCGGEPILKKYNEGELWMISCSNKCGVLMTAQCKIPTNDSKIIGSEIKKNVVINWNKRIL